jgi:hypothetical protein
MLESCLGTFIWYVFEGAQCQISKFLFSNIMWMGHFLEQVSIQKLGTQPRGHNFFQGSSRQWLEKFLFYSIFYTLDTGTGLGKGAFLQTSTNI